jgi:methylenetetrahydrofolate--tRNA-(uracil-5-)-methyltransferase
MPKVCIIGAGLAGSELAYQLSKNDIDITLYEARLKKDYNDGVHKTSDLAELVCSNSFRSNDLHNAAGLLKQELRVLDSLLMKVADEHSLPAGTALAVSRDDFSQAVTKTLLSNSKVKIVAEKVTDIKKLLNEYEYVVVAAGPVASPELCAGLQELIGERYLYFYDAMAPLVDVSTVDMKVCFRASRYGGTGEEGDYINAPMNKEEYYTFVDELNKAQQVPVGHGDEGVFFRGCMPVEVMALDSPDNLLNGPMRGDGLTDPRTGRSPYAAVQLRQDNTAGTVYNMVGFQTRLIYGEQERVFRTIPGFEHVEFLRLGSMHRNIYVNAPSVLNLDMSLKAEPKLFVAGQISGVEGYVESIAQAIVVSRHLIGRIKGVELTALPSTTAIGALCAYILKAETKGFQPMKMNFGLLPPLTDEDKKQFLSKGPRSFQTKLGLSKRALHFFEKLN